MEIEFLGLVVTLIAAVCALVAAVLVASTKQHVSEHLESIRVEQIKTNEKVSALEATVNTTTQRLEAHISDARRETATSLQTNAESVDKKLQDMRGIVDDTLPKRLSEQSSELRDHLGKFDTRFSGFTTQIQGFQSQITKNLSEVRSTIDTQLKAIREDNNKQLEQVRTTVDEKLSKTLNDNLSRSFKQVSDQLDAVHKGLGEMHTLAKDVGGLKQVLSNVKTRGVLGEVQLGAILADILTTSQYDENVATKPGSQDRVEFAIKIPVENNDFIYLPIDAKFPGDTYDQLRSAIEEGNKATIEAAQKALEARIKGEAKDISSKYISVPETTNFAIMFLPFEGLYAEVVNRPGLIELLQRDYHVNVAGPSTMAALLNSLQMCYQTLALQQRADDIAKILSAVKAEFPKYQKALVKAKDQIERAGKTVDGIITTRTNAIDRKLRDVTTMEDGEQAERLLGIDNALLDAAFDADVDEDIDEDEV